MTEHIPDPTAMSGTLDTSGIGGGHHARLTGMTHLFGDVEPVAVSVRNTVWRGAEQVVEEVEHVLHREPEQTPQPVKAPAKKTAAKKTAASDATK